MIKRSLQFNITAVIAMLAFSLSFISQNSFSSLVLYSSEWKTDIWFMACSSYGIPILIMVVGIGLLGADYDFSLDSLSVFYRVFKRNKYNASFKKSDKHSDRPKQSGLIIRSMVSCLVWWLLSALTYMSKNHSGDYDFDTLLDSMADVLESPYFIAFYQLTAVLFIFYPLFKRIASDKRLNTYAVILFFVFTIINKLIVYLPFGKYIDMFTSQIGWNNFTIYGFYLFVGVFISKIKLKWFIRMIIYSAAIISTAALYCVYVFFAQGDFSKDFTASISPLLSTIQACAVIIAAGGISEKIKPRPKAALMLNKLAESTYIYVAVFTIWFISLSTYFEFSSLSFGFRTVIELTLSFVFSSSTCYLIRKIPHIGYITT